MNRDLELRKYYFERFVLNVAIATLEQGGITARLEELQIMPASDTWIIPKYPGRTVILPLKVDLLVELKAFILSNETFLREPDCFLGTWFNSQNQQYYFDIIMKCENLSEAKRIAIELSEREGRKIVALYNSGRRETVYL